MYCVTDCCQSAKVGQHRTREGNGYQEWRESVAAFTLRTNDLVSSLRSWAASALLTCDWDTLCSFHEVLYPRFRSSGTFDTEYAQDLLKRAYCSVSSTGVGGLVKKITTPHTANNTPNAKKAGAKLKVTSNTNGAITGLMADTICVIGRRVPVMAPR